MSLFLCTLYSMYKVTVRTLTMVQRERQLNSTKEATHTYNVINERSPCIFRRRGEKNYTFLLFPVWCKVEQHKWARLQLDGINCYVYIKGRKGRGGGENRGGIRKRKKEGKKEKERQGQERRIITHVITYRYMYTFILIINKRCWCADMKVLGRRVSSVRDSNRD